MSGGAAAAERLTPGPRPLYPPPCFLPPLPTPSPARPELPARESCSELPGRFRRGPSGPRFGPRNDKIKHVQNQVDEVIDVMQENITKVIERGERLDELQDKSESLSDNATAFSNRSKQLRRQMWWRGCKIKAIMALVAAILLLVIISKYLLDY
uniref:Vesicle associated membrane protein 4 n=1 Tax=Sus scrofa TaxID=9823 RepID=A0A8D1TN35_PIG